MKTVYKELLNIYGIGPSYANKIINILGITKITTSKQLPPHLIDKYNQLIGNIKNLTTANSQFTPIESKLLLLQRNQVSQLITLRTLRGVRISLGYPARGQRTRSNAITAKKLSHKWKL